MICDSAHSVSNHCLLKKLLVKILPTELEQSILFPVNKIKIIMHANKLKRQWRAAALTILCFTALLCLHGLRAPKLLKDATEPVPSESDLEEMQYEAQLHRYLLKTLDESHLMEDYEYDAAPPNNEEETSQGEGTSPIGTKKQTPFMASLSSYTLEDAIHEADVFRFTFAVMIFDPTSDKFLGYFSKDHQWRSSFVKLQSSMRHLSFMLRRTFPERFTASSPEFAMAISSGDNAQVHLSKIPHSGGVAPVLHFGSVFSDETLFPNLIAMPMPGLHLDCFTEWVDFGRVCGNLRDLAFGEELGLEWDNLKVMNYLLSVCILLPLAYPNSHIITCTVASNTSTASNCLERYRL